MTSLLTLVLTIVCTFVILIIAVVVFMRIGSPVYRLEIDNLIALLELVVSEAATKQDWDVFMAVPIRHNDRLLQVQRRCHAIASEHYIGGKHLFSDTGRQLLNGVLEELKQDLNIANT